MLFGIVIGTYSSIFIAAPLPAAISASSASGAGRPSSRPAKADAAGKAAARERGLEMTARAAPLPRAGADRCLRQRRLPLRRDEPPRLDPVPAERHLRLAARAARTRSDAAALAPALAEKDALGLLLLGTGRRQQLPGAEVRRAFDDGRHRARGDGYRAPPAAPTTCCWPRGGPWGGAAGRSD